MSFAFISRTVPTRPEGWTSWWRAFIRITAGGGWTCWNSRRATAGSLVIWHGKKLPVQRAPAKPEKAERIPLRDVPGLHDGGWVQERNGVRRELIFSAPGQDGTLREDRDGDGVFERQFTVHVGE